MLEYFSKATLFYPFVPGKQNPSNYLSKLFLDPIEAVNSTLWRHGPDLLSKEETFKGGDFYKVDITGDEVLGLPEKYIQRPIKEEVDKINVEGSSFGNAMSDFNCYCVKLEDCGLYLT